MASSSIGTSLALINGKPAISYQNALIYDQPDDRNAELKYAYSSTLDGSSGWSTLVVDWVHGALGAYSSLAEINGKPAIGYSADAFDTLKYAYSSSVDGSSGWTTLELYAEDDNSSGATQISLKLVAGHPAIAFCDISDLLYFHSSTADGSSGWSTVTVDVGGLDGGYASLAVIGGKPAISYQDWDQLQLRYAVSTETDGSSGWTSQAVDVHCNVGFATSLAEVAGQPAISHMDLYHGVIKYTRLPE